MGDVRCKGVVNRDGDIDGKGHGEASLFMFAAGKVTFLVTLSTVSPSLLAKLAEVSISDGIFGFKLFSSSEYLQLSVLRLSVSCVVMTLGWGEDAGVSCLQANILCRQKKAALETEFFLSIPLRRIGLSSLIRNF